jgi:hypothetical protein
MRIFTKSVVAIVIVLGMSLPGWVAHAQPVINATGFQPVAQSAFVTVTAGSATSTNQTLFVVPAGKLLIVEHFSSQTLASSGVSVARIFLGVFNPGATSWVAAHTIAPSYTAPCGVFCPGSGEEIFVSSQPVRMYATAGQSLVANVAFSGAVGAATFFGPSFTGYLVDAP